MRKIVELDKIEIESVDFTWIETYAFVRETEKGDKIIAKNLIICQGNKGDPNIIHLTASEIELLILKLKETLRKLKE